MLRRGFLKSGTSLGAIAAMGVRSSLAAEAEKKAIPGIAGPDQNTKPPTFKARVGTVDTHCHIFGPAAQYPFSPTRRAIGGRAAEIAGR